MLTENDGEYVNIVISDIGHRCHLGNGNSQQKVLYNAEKKYQATSSIKYIESFTNWQVNSKWHEIDTKTRNLQGLQIPRLALQYNFAKFKILTIMHVKTTCQIIFSSTSLSALAQILRLCMLIYRVAQSSPFVAQDKRFSF